MNTPGIQMAYLQGFQKWCTRLQKLGRVAFKPTQAMKDGINTGSTHDFLKVQFKISRRWAVNAYDEHKENVDKIIALLPLTSKTE